MVAPLAYDSKANIHLSGRSNPHRSLGNIVLKELPIIQMCITCLCEENENGKILFCRAAGY